MYSLNCLKSKYLCRTRKLGMKYTKFWKLKGSAIIAWDFGKHFFVITVTKCSYKTKLYIGSLIDGGKMFSKNNDTTNSFQTLHREKSRLIQYV